MAKTARYAPAADYAVLIAQLQSRAAATNADIAAWLRCAQAHPEDPLLALHVQRLQVDATDDLIVLDDK